MDNLFGTSNKTKDLSSQQCYLSTYQDPISSVEKDSYICFCDDKIGCNSAIKLSKSIFLLIAVSFFYFHYCHFSFWSKTNSKNWDLILPLLMFKNRIEFFYLFFDDVYFIFTFIQFKYNVRY